MNEKKCSDCGKPKPAKEYTKSPKYKDGLLKRCKDCEKKRLALKEDSPEYAQHYFTHDKYYI